MIMNITRTFFAFIFLFFSIFLRAETISFPLEVPQKEDAENIISAICKTIKQLDDALSESQHKNALLTVYNAHLVHLFVQLGIANGYRLDKDFSCEHEGVNLDIATSPDKKLRWYTWLDSKHDEVTIAHLQAEDSHSEQPLYRTYKERNPQSPVDMCCTIIKLTKSLKQVQIQNDLKKTVYLRFSVNYFSGVTTYRIEALTPADNQEHNPAILEPYPLFISEYGEPETAQSSLTYTYERIVRYGGTEKTYYLPIEPEYDEERQIISIPDFHLIYQHLAKLDTDNIDPYSAREVLYDQFTTHPEEEFGLYHYYKFNGQYFVDTRNTRF